MIPKEIIYNQKMNQKRIILFSYFAIKRGLDNTVGFTCDDVVDWCGYKINYRQDKTNDQITTAISLLKDGGYINITGSVCRNNYNKAKIIEDKFDDVSQFALIYVDEIEKIRDFKKYTKDVNRMNTAILILVLSYIRVNMLRRQNGYVGKESDKPEFCYRLFKDIEKDIGISTRYISRSVKILNELDLIVSQEMPRYKDEADNWHTDVTLFVNRYRRAKGNQCLDSTYDYTKEIEWGIKYINDKKYLSKKFYQEL